MRVWVESRARWGVGEVVWVRKLKSVNIPPGGEGSVKLTNCDPKTNIVINPNDDATILQTCRFQMHNCLPNVNENNGTRRSWSSTSGKPPPLWKCGDMVISNFWDMGMFYPLAISKYRHRFIASFKKEKGSTLYENEHILVKQ